MAKTTITWDSCVVIEAIQQEPSRYPALLPMIREAETGGLRIVISSASLSEILYLRWLSSQGIPQAEHERRIERWLENEWVTIRIADVGICQDAAHLRRTHRTDSRTLTSVDSIILSTALKTKSDALITYDDGKSEPRQLGLLQLHERVGSPPLRIVLPENWSMQDQLDLGLPTAK